MIEIEINLELFPFQMKRQVGTMARSVSTLELFNLAELQFRLFLFKSNQIKSNQIYWQMWVKTAEVLTRDRLLGSFSVSY